ncbi:MAG TPA: 5-oxoprolinase subunit PxpB [Motilibacteraceae bacterium]|nr:5-oxoprolinase subunit PxpB [Motilibacteraceae bacterium]
MGARFLPCGDAGLLVEVDDPADVLPLHLALRERMPAGVVDAVPAARTLLLHLDPGLTSPRRVSEAVSEVLSEFGDVTAQRRSYEPEAGELVHVPVVYDGEDLQEVAELTGLAAEDVVSLHQESVWTVAFCGFAPGFGYLTGGHERLAVPRRPTPRTRVPAGAVGLAGPYSGIYPRSSPGGWQLIGRTDARVWDVEREPPALLRPGVRVRFVAQPGE